LAFPWISAITRFETGAGPGSALSGPGPTERGQASAGHAPAGIPGGSRVRTKRG